MSIYIRYLEYSLTFTLELSFKVSKAFWNILIVVSKILVVVYFSVNLDGTTQMPLKFEMGLLLKYLVGADYVRHRAVSWNVVHCWVTNTGPYGVTGLPEGWVFG